MIPKHLHAIWVGSPLPGRWRAFLEEWRRLHPSWQFTLWGDDMLPLLANQHLYDRASEYCPGFEGQLRSDIARLEILEQYGGVYIDVDFEPIRAIDPLLEGVECFMAWEIQGMVANNAIIGARPRHPFIGRLIDGLEDSITGNPGKRPSKISGPHYVTAQLRKDGDGVKIFDRDMFYRIGCKELSRLSEPHHPSEWARHHWNNQQRLKSMKQGRRRR